MTQPTSASPAAERREVTFGGRVQGVGFRYTVRQIAERHPVVGYIQNLFDGRVLLVVEGRSEALDKFLTEVQAAMRRYVESLEVSTRPATGEFQGFEVRI